VVKCIQSWLLPFNGVATHFDHCASSGVVSEMLASGKYLLRVPEALQFAFLLEAMVGEALEVL
jgi:hypothetical protein